MTSTFADASKAYDKHGHLIRTPPMENSKRPVTSNMARRTGLPSSPRAAPSPSTAPPPPFLSSLRPITPARGSARSAAASAWANSPASLSARRRAFASRRIPPGSSSTSKRQPKLICVSRPSADSRPLGFPGSSRRSSVTAAEGAQAFSMSYDGFLMKWARFKARGEEGPERPGLMLRKNAFLFRKNRREGTLPTRSGRHTGPARRAGSESLR